MHRDSNLSARRSTVCLSTPGLTPARLLFPWVHPLLDEWLERCVSRRAVDMD